MRLPLLLAPVHVLPARVQGQPKQPPFAEGASTGGSWDCNWRSDVSGTHVHALGLADRDPGPPGTGSGPAEEGGQHASAAACERWCCQAMDVSIGPQIPGGRRASLGVVGGSPCELWQWTELSAADQWKGGCWVGTAEATGERTPNSKWIGAEVCLHRPLRWGAVFLLATAAFALLYLGGGTFWGRKSGRAGPGRLGPLKTHPHAQHWLSLWGLVGDGVALARGDGRHRGAQQSLLPATSRRDAGRTRASGGGKPRRSGKSERRKEAEEAGELPAAEPAAAGEGGAAGGRAGGRWVHVEG